MHREIVPANRRKFIEWCEKTFCIRYTDGTSLELTIRPALPREKVVEKKGYTSLIHDCFRHNVRAVADLPN